MLLVIFDCFQLSYQRHHHLQTAYYILLYCCISTGFIEAYSKLVAANNEWIVRTMLEILSVLTFNCSLSCDMVSGALCFAEVLWCFGWCLSQRARATWVIKITEYQINTDLDDSIVLIYATARKKLLAVIIEKYQHYFIWFLRNSALFNFCII